MAQRSDLRPTDPGLSLTADALAVESENHVGAALGAPPRWEKQLLELRLDWQEADEQRPFEPDDGRRWAQARLRVFLLTWDPFEWLADRAAAFATTARRPDGTGLVLYVPHWQALRLAGGDPDLVAVVVGGLAESVLSVAAEHRGLIVDGGYPSAVIEGRAPALLSRLSSVSRLAPPRLSLSGAGWQPIGFDALEDLAQDAFGPAELDRSPVHFSRRGSAARCPGCRGAAVDFPDGLGVAQEVLCDLHRPEALRITTARLEAARASNPAGWDALVEAGQRLLEPHLPDGLGPRLLAAATGGAVGGEDVAAQTALVAEAAAEIKSLPEADTPLGRRLVPVRAWLAAFADELVAEGDDDLAAARTGAEVLLGTTQGTFAPSREAVPEGPATSGTSDTSDSPESPAGPAGPDDSPARGDADAEVEAPPPKREPYRRPERVGRNAPCPCGSGKKYKFCHG